jgi:hypothetical protein
LYFKVRRIEELRMEMRRQREEVAKVRKGRQREVGKGRWRDLPI